MTIILGIDPGSRVTGYGLIREEKTRTLHYLDSGCIRTGEGNFHHRLYQIFKGISYLMETFKPDEVSIEQVFMHQNPNSALKLGHARGAALVACAQHSVEIYEYAPREIKQAIVGYGAAQKTQVQHMVVHLLKLNRAPQQDAADALAIAICHSYHRRFVQTTMVNVHGA